MRRRAGDEHALVGRERKEVIRVAEERDGLAGRLQRHAPVALAAHLIGQRQPRQRILKQAKRKLEAQDAAHGGVDPRLGDLAVLDQRRQVLDERQIGRHHAHVDAGLNGHLRRFPLVGRHTVERDELFDVEPVGDHQPLEAEFVAQQVRQQVAAGMHGHAVHLARVHHHRRRACVDRGPEWRKVLLAKLNVGEPCGGAVAAALRSRVADEVLQARRHMLRRA